ncbi:MAG: TraB/GumN family protein [Gammaproteobacteria bacterium]|nr:TraB/GumN family protein [Gammaproteobacteria bacterium]
MDVKSKALFYRTAQIICCLFWALFAQNAFSGPESRAVLHPQGLLWKIQKNNQPPSYLFGTIHISDSRVIQLLDVVQTALQETDVFAMEVILDQHAQIAISRASFFSDDELLEDYIDTLQLDRINQIMYQYYGINPEIVNRMKPWAVMATISSPPPESNKTVLDIQLQSLASEYDHPVFGLETVAEQVEALSGMTRAEQLWLLNKSVDDFEKNMGLLERMIESYLKRDLQGLIQEQAELMDDKSSIDDRFMEKLLDQRNLKMAERMIAIMKNKSVFVAIGALHLPGKKGVLHLLEKAGYQVEKIY